MRYNSEEVVHPLRDICNAVLFRDCRSNMYGRVNESRHT